MKYFFTFFRIFRLEHTKLAYFFADYNLIDTVSFLKLTYNQNFADMAELQYHNIHSNNNIKFLIFVGYFALMPIILAVDFFFSNCTYSFKYYHYIHEKIALRYFFSGPIFMLTLFFLPVTISALLELKYFNIGNEF